MVLIPPKKFDKLRMLIKKKRLYLFPNLVKEFNSIKK